MENLLKNAVQEYWKMPKGELKLNLEESEKVCQLQKLEAALIIIILILVNLEYSSIMFREVVDLTNEESMLRNRKLIGWEIYYANGLVLNSEFNKWEKCKQTGVQVVKMFYDSDNGIEVNIHHNQEYYILNDLLDLPKTIKIGKAIDGEKFYSILNNAKNSNRIISKLQHDTICS